MVGPRASATRSGRTGRAPVAEPVKDATSPARSARPSSRAATRSRRTAWPLAEMHRPVRPVPARAPPGGDAAGDGRRPVRRRARASSRNASGCCEGRALGRQSTRQRGAHRLLAGAAAPSRDGRRAAARPGVPASPSPATSGGPMRRASPHSSRTRRAPRRPALARQRGHGVAQAGRHRAGVQHQLPAAHHATRRTRERRSRAITRPCARPCRRRGAGRAAPKPGDREQRVHVPVEPSVPRSTGTIRRTAGPRNWRPSSGMTASGRMRLAPDRPRAAARTAPSRPRAGPVRPHVTGPSSTSAREPLDLHAHRPGRGDRSRLQPPHAGRGVDRPLQVQRTAQRVGPGRAPRAPARGFQSAEDAAGSARLAAAGPSRTRRQLSRAGRGRRRGPSPRPGTASMRTAASRPSGSSVKQTPAAHAGHEDWNTDAHRGHLVRVGAHGSLDAEPRHADRVQRLSAERTSTTVFDSPATSARPSPRPRPTSGRPGGPLPAARATLLDGGRSSLRPRPVPVSTAKPRAPRAGPDETPEPGRLASEGHVVVGHVREVAQSQGHQSSRLRKRSDATARMPVPIAARITHSRQRSARPAPFRKMPRITFE